MERFAEMLTNDSLDDPLAIAEGIAKFYIPALQPML
jgi:hypothetical protein